MRSDMVMGYINGFWLLNRIYVLKSPTDQKQQRVKFCEEIRHFASDDVTFLSRAVTVDENWIYV
jgi:hypothetical protein